MGSSIKKRIGPYQKLFYRTKALTSLIGDKFMSKTLVLINCIKNYPKLSKYAVLIWFNFNLMLKNNV